MEPLRADHGPGLREAASHPEIWEWLGPYMAETDELWAQFMDQALEASAEGSEVAFVTVDARTGQPIGSSRYLALRPVDRALEIGWTWLTPAAWRTGANAEAKLLMMSHAFGALGCVRVEFKTDARNERSRAALAALPAEFEGVFRKHRIVPGVGQRDSAYFSVIDDEWARVKANLQSRLEVAA
ncbi:MAG: N-acetyltransferase [Thermoleophilaceae bacterium]|jgi:RimJ/RimL family protein N-acetyltransferase|nr:N-acetyltransferase [Thermoleophilaceae bacterium]